MRARFAALALVLGLVVAACFVELWPHVYGTATVAWTIDGRVDPALCAEHGAVFVHVVLRNDDDEIVGDDWPECRELAVRYVLRRGWQHASLTLVDANRASLASRETGSFYVDGERDVRVVVDLTPRSVEPTVTTARE